MYGYFGVWILDEMTTMLKTTPPPDNWYSSPINHLVYLQLLSIMSEGRGAKNYLACLSCNERSS
jgi:hypothetical protein